MGPMVRCSSEELDQWAFANGRHRRAPQNGYAERLIGSIRRSALTTLLCSASDTSVRYCCRTGNITTWCGRIFLWRRMRRPRAPLRGQGTFFAAQFSAGYATNMSEFDLRQAQLSVELDRARDGLQTGRGRTEKLAPSRRSQPVAKTRFSV